MAIFVFAKESPLALCEQILPEPHLQRHRVFQYKGLSRSINIFDNESLPKTHSLRLRLKSKSTLPDKFSLQYDCARIEGHNKEAGFRLA